MKNFNRCILCIVFFCCIFVLCSCKLQTEPFSKTGFYFDTIVTITLYDEKDAAYIDDAFELCSQYEKRFSRTIADSEISRLNADGQLRNADSTTIDIVTTALRYSQLTEGAFDISIAPLSILWNFTGENPSVPAAASIAAARKSVDYTQISVSQDTITLQQGMAVDLGGIAKGYIADAIKQYLQAQGVTRGIINLGGNILTFGEKPDGSPFKLGIQYPYAASGQTIASFETSDCSLVSSGCYERYFEENGVQYHHILNPRTGYPVENDLLSVTILSESSAAGDALSTACYVLGKEKATQLLQTLDGIEAVFVDKDYKISVTDGLSYDAETKTISRK